MAAIDVDQVVTDIAAQAAPVVSIGIAVLLLVVAIKTYQWIRTAFLGGGSKDGQDDEWRWEDEREGVFDQDGNELDRAP